MHNVNHFQPRPNHRPNPMLVVRGETTEQSLEKTDALFGGETPEGEIGGEFLLVYNKLTGEGTYKSESHGSIGNYWENEQDISRGSLSENESINQEKNAFEDYPRPRRFNAMF